MTWPSRGEYLESTLVSRPTHPRPPSPSPAGLFELSGNFFPELYTTHEGLSSVPVLIYSAFEGYSNAISRTNHYELYFLKSQRQWRKLSLSLTFCRASHYWDYTKLSTTEVAFGSTSYNLPRSLQDKLEQLLRGIEDLRQDTHLSLTVSEQVSTEIGLPWSHFNVHQRLPEIERVGKSLISNLDHLGCQRYYENEVVQIANFENPRAFAVCVGNRLLLESRISALAEDFSLYTIHVLHCLQGAPGIAKFAGVVTDSSGLHVKSFLREIPVKGWMDSVIGDAIDQGTSIHWSRRERWAQDIVEAVAQLHSKGFVVGVLGQFACASIAIDSADRALLCSFRNKAWADNNLPGHLPPELRIMSAPKYSRAYSRPQIGHLDVTPQCDIFQLGAILWLIACGQKPRLWRHCCYYEGCSFESGACIRHATMITMPPLPDSVPQYYIDMISLCRSEDPSQRPPARKLLQMFPVAIDTRVESERSQEELMLKALLVDTVRPQLYCDSCGDGILESAFHCNICESGDYDLCGKCIGNRAHCKDPSHFLVEMNAKGGHLLATNNYYSSVKETGNRDIIHL
jgi:hypothetical protein